MSFQRSRTGPRLLVTGFGPFPGVRVNPTAQLAVEVARRLSARGLAAEALVLETSWTGGLSALAARLRDDPPDALLMLGVASRARWIRVERYGRTGSGGAAPDATGRRPEANAPSVTLPATAALEPALAALIRRGLRARLSPSAGRYLCNASYALALHQAGRGGRPTLFVHVPRWVASALAPALADIGRGLMREARGRG